jgi:hypothetical protein
MMWLGGLLWPFAPARAEQPDIRDRHVVILVKALSYDEKIVERAGREMVVAVVYSSGESGAGDEAEAWRESFAKLSTVRFLGLPFRAIKLAVGTPDRLRKAITQEGIDALFVVGAMKDELPWIQKVSRESKILTLASREPQIPAGLSLGVFVIEGKNTLLINLSAARAEGSLFSSAIFPLAKVIR